MYTSLHLPKKIIQIVSSVYFKVFRLLDPFLFQKKINETLCNGILKIRCPNHLSKLIEKYFVGFTVSPLYALLKKINKKQTIRRDISMDSVNYGQC